MAATITVADQWSASQRQYSRGTGNLGTYADGGVSITANMLKLGVVDNFRVSGIDGYDFHYDYTNAKMKAYYRGEDPAPLLVVEEVVTVASNVGTLAYKPLHVVAVDVTAGSTTGAFHVIPTGETPITTQVAVTFTSGLLTFLASDAVTSVRVTYVPQQPVGALSAANLVIDEEITAAAAKTNLANRACMVQYVWNDTNGVRCSLEPSGEAPSATNTAVVDINDSSNTSVDTNATDDGDTLKVTYVKYAALPNADMFIDDTDITLSSEAYDFAAVAGYDGIVIPALGTQLVGETGAAANAEIAWGGPSATAANNVAQWIPSQNYILTNQTAALATTAISWVVLSPVLLPPPFGEVGAGHDISGVTFQFVAEGPY